MNHNSGTIKIVDEDATCKLDESALDWNAEGAGGENGISEYERVEVESEFSDVPPMTAKGLQIDCPSGTKVLGGGSLAQDFMIPIESDPLSETAWFVRHLNIHRETLNDVLITGYASCANVTP